MTPNVSAVKYHQWTKEPVWWREKKRLYISVVFTWDIEKAIHLACAHDGPVSVGGPAAMLMPEAFRGIARVVKNCPTRKLHGNPVRLHNRWATFTTRGCIRNCAFCSVPKVEGGFREIRTFWPRPIVCDNNFLAASRAHQERVVKALRKFNYVDFNQGLDARLFTPEVADRLGRLRLHARFSFDHVNMESEVADAIKLCRERTTRKISVYVLFGFRDTPEDAYYRLELVRSWKIRPNPMRYQPLDAFQKNSYVAPGWTERDLKRYMRYYGRLRWLEHIPFKDFEWPKGYTP